MRYLHVMALAASALAGAASAASAQQAYTTNDAGLRAGPGMRYPLVRVVPGDAVVYIHGCLRNWDWCDVSWRRSRGWVFSDNLEGIYNNRRVGFDRWRGNVEVPFVSFGFGYWDRYYRDRPWYGNWERWGDRNDRTWRQRHHDSNGGWNDNGSGAGNNHNRTGSDGNGEQTTRRDRHRDNNPNDNTGNANDNTGNGNGEPTARRDRHRDNKPKDNNTNRKGNTGNDDQHMQCAPDDPSCSTTGNAGHKRRSNQQTEAPPMEVQPQ